LLEEHAQVVAVVAADGIARPLFDFNMPVVETAIAALGKDPAFVGAAVFDTDGKQVAVAGRIPEQGDNIVRRQDLTFDNNGKPTLVGRLVLVMSRSAVLQYLHKGLLQSVITGVLLLGAIALTVSLSLRRISKPLKAMRRAMERVAGGESDLAISGVERHDEIGAMARTLEVFRDNMRDLRRLDTERQTETQAKEASRLALESLVQGFAGRMESVAADIAGAAGTMHDEAQTLSETAAQTSQRAATVANVSDQASSNVGNVASLAEDLSAAIAEITDETAAAARIAAKAVDEANGTMATMHGLTAAAEHIGAVVQLIQQIANQTNLLALNATIEAARAGDAGKGFAVVASEVKNLAAQTAKATGDIQAQVDAIQAESSRAAKAIGSVAATIGEISAATSKVVAAVQRQGEATREIVSNVQQAAAGTTGVSETITGVTEAAERTGGAASQLLDASGNLSRQSELLHTEVTGFVDRMRAV
jgi:methyl-accepting chemotaxis protein